MEGKGDNKKEKKEKAPKQEAKKQPETEEEAKPVEKKADPFEKMPKGTFDLEEWKWFWEHFDHENYSIWRGDYKYNDELTMVFMSCNLIGGMFQRLEKLKKNAFASCCLFGQNNDSTISG